MTSSLASEHLNILCQCVRSATVHGGFLLSTGKTSKYWVAIGRLRAPYVIDAVLDTLRVCLPNFQSKTSIETILVPQFTTTSEDEFPFDFVISQLRNYTVADGRSLNFCGINFDRHLREVEIPENLPPGKCLGLFAISVHVDMIMAIVDALQHRKRTIHHVLVIIEREQITRQRLQKRGVELVPCIVCDEYTGEPTTILDMKKLPYLNYHEYFVE